MHKRKLLSIALMALMILAAAPVVFAQYTPEVFAVDQDVVNETVSITRATINGDGWVVIHADQDGAPGPVIGYAPIMDGINASIDVPIDVGGLTDTLHAMLHVDEGTAGEYEFPGPDVPLMVDDAVVTVPFQVTGVVVVTPEPTEEPVEEAAEEEATPEPTAEAAEEAAEEATAEPTEEPAEEAAAEPTEEPAEESAEASADDAMMAADIVDTAVAAGGFEKLVAAVQAAGLEDALRGEGPFTVFAPTDAAFDALPAGLFDSLLEDTDTLTQVLLYHVVPDKLMASDVAKMGSALTLESSMVNFAVDGDAVMVDDANVVAADVEASNGVIHVIDAVLLPPAVQEALAGAEAAAAEPEVEETPEPVQKISASYQESDGASVTVDSVEAAQDSWVVIHANDGIAPGAVLGYTAVPAGVSTDVVVELDEPLAEGGMLWAMLHVDDGELGTYEFPDADAPAAYLQSTVMAPFNVALASAAMEEATPEPTEEAMEEATPEPTEEAMEEATPEPTEEAMEEATPEPTEEAMEEATAEPTEEAMEEATPEPTEEAMEEATAEPTEEAMEEATPEPTEETMEEPAVAPEELPETGGRFGGMSTTLPTVGIVLLVLVAGAWVTRRRPA